jgi:mannosyltransferase OCH1-like enzyme
VLSRQFIEQEFSWFLETFDSYPYPIQRADAIRYFVLAHYGGIYLDLDDGCRRKLDPLLAYPAWVRITIPTGISNDAMGSVPGHPFFLKVIDSLKKYKRNWPGKYITVMYTTGPLFLSVIWKEYINFGRTGSEQVRLLMPNEYSKKAWAFFKISKGSSWHGQDAKTIFWMGQHWGLITAFGFALAGIIGFSLWYACFHVTPMGAGKKASKGFLIWPFRNSRKKGDYELVDHIA